MKTLILFCAIYLLSGAAPVVMQQHGFAKVNFVPPQYPGGENAMNQFIEDNLTYPAESKANGEEATIDVHFTVETNGSLTKIYSKDRRDHPLLAEEAIRIVKLMPKWKCAGNNGRPMVVGIGIPIEFKL